MCFNEMRVHVGVLERLEGEGKYMTHPFENLRVRAEGENHVCNIYMWIFSIDEL